MGCSGMCGGGDSLGGSFRTPSVLVRRSQDREAEPDSAGRASSLTVATVATADQGELTVVGSERTVAPRRLKCHGPECAGDHRNLALNCEYDRIASLLSVQPLPAPSVRLPGAQGHHPCRIHLPQPRRHARVTAAAPSATTPDSAPMPAPTRPWSASSFSAASS